MIVIKRNQIIVTALVIMVAIAGYLNYTDRKNNELANNKSNSELTIEPADINYDEFANNGILDGEINIATTNNLKENEVKSVNAADNAKASANTNEIVPNESLASSDTAGENGTAVFVNNNLDDTYFVQAKLEREQARAKQKDVLTEMINNANVEKEQRAECANAMLDIQKRIEKETSAEAMIKAKGFDEAYVRIDDNTVDVVVSKTELTDAEKAQIEDIVVRKTGMSVDNIRISPLKDNQ